MNYNDNETEPTYTVGDFVRERKATLFQDTYTIVDYDDGDTTASYGRLERIISHNAPEDDATSFLVLDVLGGSDYSGSSVERANHRAFLEQFGKGPWIVDLHGGHGTYAIAIRLDCNNADLIDCLKGLEDYPVVDENTLGEVEQEQDAEAWESWARDDFRKEINNRFGVDVSEVSDDDIARIFEAACTETNTYFECDGADRYIRVDEVVKGCKLADLLELPGATQEEDAAETQVRAERRDLEKRQARTLSHGYGGGGHQLKQWTPHYSENGQWAERQGHPATSMCECQDCGRTGWVNVRPVDGAPTIGGTIFAEHCKHGNNPATSCPDCGLPREGPAGTVGAWVGSHGGFMRALAGTPCRLHAHARQQ